MDDTVHIVKEVHEAEQANGLIKVDQQINDVLQKVDEGATLMGVSLECTPIPSAMPLLLDCPVPDHIEQVISGSLGKSKPKGLEVLIPFEHPVDLSLDPEEQCVVSGILSNAVGWRHEFVSVFKCEMQAFQVKIASKVRRRIGIPCSEYDLLYCNRDNNWWADFMDRDIIRKLPEGGGVGEHYTLCWTTLEGKGLELFMDVDREKRLMNSLCELAIILGFDLGGKHLGSKNVPRKIWVKLAIPQTPMGLEILCVFLGYFSVVYQWSFSWDPELVGDFVLLEGKTTYEHLDDLFSLALNNGGMRLRRMSYQTLISDRRPWFYPKTLRRVRALMRLKVLEVVVNLCKRRKVFLMKHDKNWQSAVMEKQWKPLDESEFEGYDHEYGCYCENCSDARWVEAYGSD